MHWEVDTEEGDEEEIGFSLGQDMFVYHVLRFFQGKQVMRLPLQPRHYTEVAKIILPAHRHTPQFLKLEDR